MEKNELDITLTPVALAGFSEINALRLIAGEEDALLVTSVFRADPAVSYAYENLFAAHRWPLEAAGRAQEVVIPQMLPGPPGWDAVRGGEGDYTLVYEVDGGATNTLHLKSVEPRDGDSPDEDAQPDPGPLGDGRIGGGLVQVRLEDLAEEDGSGEVVVSASQPWPGFNHPRFVASSLKGEGFAVSAISYVGKLVLFFPDE